ncbi:bifunctional phosphopantothenoylcysteine decarboxylase/phosphopantothenate--cysteine ligase CoaBC [Lentilactobacillus farraginis]|uniref:Coenzyme A biosynthesis bifunctional protein CoaBC n=1 Tax=Lentilactobacillus farraginis DSM 18382 = JCM 14108 TaxID=1423743 RepID=X0QDQ6_9LACO|nr:bifunctional phosphopantothenoylcysteine decarboxylase/phosphopantothenate--cysteine ligase CoaBC [Lentilactobacillus farraginis]GAF36755.1 phosphopantothenoylcysteine decarboxylase [Lentilactobacillus farraginis DSM 18382 = JCM 14108]
MFQNKRVSLYVTGSIAVYKSLILTRLLVKNHNDVRVVMTEAAQKFVSPLTFQSLSKNKVIKDDFSTDNPKTIPHIDLADHSDLAIVAPATANTIAKMANGIADNVVNAALLATTAPIYVVPAMNVHMLANFATQANLKTLTDAGIHIMDTAEGFLAEGYAGKGRFPEPEEILTWLNQQFKSRTAELAGKKLLISAGGTREPLDPVRYLTNHSSGKMGFAIAEAAQAAGADVTLIAANTSLPVPDNVKVVRVQTARELLAAIKARFSEADALIMAAAVADYRPANVAEQKIKKTAQNTTMTLELVRNPDILKEIGLLKKPDQLLIGFAAETNDLITNAEKKIKAKHLDLIVANDVSQRGIGFNADNNQVTFLFKNGEQQKTAIESKQRVAKQLIEILSHRLFN